MIKRSLAILAVLLLLAPMSIATAGDGGKAKQDNTNKNTAPKNERRSPGRDKPPHSLASAYKDRECLGWKLHVHEDLLADEELYNEVYGELHHQLFRITKVVPEDKVELLKEVPIWIELRNPYSGNCQYHPSRGWLEGNGYLPEKAKAVELSSAKGFLRSSQGHQPFVMLHELAHAYHDLHVGFNHKGIAGCYKAAKQAGSYDEVLHINGRTVRAYAMVDHKEYFAEATEAYFGTNDHYPYVRSELKQHDPAMFEMVREVWGVGKKK